MVLFAVFGAVIFIAVILCVMKGRGSSQAKTVAFQEEVDVVRVEQQMS